MKMGQIRVGDTLRNFTTGRDERVTRAARLSGGGVAISTEEMPKNTCIIVSPDDEQGRVN